MPVYKTCQIKLWNFISQDCYIVNTTYMLCRELLCHCSCSCNIYAFWSSVTAPNTAAVQTCLLVAAKWMLAGLWPLKQHARWPFVTLYSMPAGVVLLYLLYLLVWCLTISRACWYGVSLWAVPAGVVLHYRSCLLVWYLIKMWNFISQDCYIVNTTHMLCRELLCHCSCSCNIYAFWPSVTAPNTAAVQTCLLVAAKWMLAGLWPLKQHARWPFVTLYSMPAGVVLLYLLYLLVWCLTISRACWYGVSLWAVPAGVVLHYRSCLLVWYLTISHAFWFGASL